jgi:hypothetical protein
VVTDETIDFAGSIIINSGGSSIAQLPVNMVS